MTATRALGAQNIFFSAGEPSGDLHAAKVLGSLQTHFGEGQLTARGFGGVELQAKGCQLDYELTKLAVVGFVEVVPKLREFFRVADVASEVFDANRPEAVMLVDFPGFNWHIAKRAKERGIPVFYYLPPQLWAWGSHRLKKMRRTVDHVLCNLPFEQQWYADRGMEVEYVGHPFFDEVQERVLDREFMDQYSDCDGCQVVVLPGSRSREVKHIWPMQLEIIRELAQRHPTARFSVACLKQEHQRACEQVLSAADKSLNVQFFTGRTSELIELADCSLMKSGSVSLEMMARGTPSVIVYQVGRAFYEIGKRLTDIRSMTLPNLIADKTIMPEFLAVGRRTSSTIEKSIAALDRLMSDPSERLEQQAELARLTHKFGQPGASHRAAQFVARKLGIQPSRIPMRAAA